MSEHCLTIEQAIAIANGFMSQVKSGDLLNPEKADELSGLKRGIAAIHNAFVNNHPDSAILPINSEAAEAFWNIVGNL